MKSKLYTTMLFSALVAAAAFAQNDPATQPGSTYSGSPTGKELGRQAMMHGTPIQASKITGAQVKSSTGETLGSINDLIINPQSGRIEFAVLSVTGPTGTTPTGAGEKLTPVPWRLLNFNSASATAGQCNFTANVDRSKLTSAPNFDKNQWPDFSDSDWNHKVWSYYGITPREGGTGTDKGASGLVPKSNTPQ